MQDSGNLVSALLAGSKDLLAQMGKQVDLWACLMLLYEMPEGKKQWLLDPSYEECCSLSNNLVLYVKVGQKSILQVGADQNRSSYSVQNSQNLNFKPSCVAISDLKEAVKHGESIC
jgi:hypothetical protein